MCLETKEFLKTKKTKKKNIFICRFYTKKLQLYTSLSLSLSLFYAKNLKINFVIDRSMVTVLKEIYYFDSSQLNFDHKIWNLIAISRRFHSCHRPLTNYIIGFAIIMGFDV